MDELVKKILENNPENLEGAELLLYNLAYQISIHPISWDLEKISALVKMVEEKLEDLEDSE